jgi:hypothetical protein
MVIMSAGRSRIIFKWVPKCRVNPYIVLEGPRRCSLLPLESNVPCHQ